MEAEAALKAKKIQQEKMEADLREAEKAAAALREKNQNEIDEAEKAAREEARKVEADLADQRAKKVDELKDVTVDLVAQGIKSTIEAMSEANEIAAEKREKERKAQREAAAKIEAEPNVLSPKPAAVEKSTAEENLAKAKQELVNEMISPNGSLAKDLNRILGVEETTEQNAFISKVYTVPERLPAIDPVKVAEMATALEKAEKATALQADIKAAQAKRIQKVEQSLVSESF